MPNSATKGVSAEGADASKSKRISVENRTSIPSIISQTHMPDFALFVSTQEAIGRLRSEYEKERYERDKEFSNLRAEKERDMSNRDREIAAIRSEREKEFDLLQFAWKMNERDRNEKRKSRRSDRK